MDLKNDEINEQGTAEFMESNASKLGIKTGHYHSYYLLKLSKTPYENERVVSDD